MNENLLRDLHDEEIMELRTIKATLAQLEKQQIVTSENIAGLNTLITQVLESAMNDTKTQAIFAELSQAIKEFQVTLEKQSGNIQEVRKSYSSIKDMKSNDSHEIAQGVKVIREASEKIDIKAANFKLGHYATLTWATVMTITCGYFIYQAHLLKAQISPFQEESMKYRYIRMKGEASPKRIAEIEDIFDYHRNPTKIREIYKDVITFEEAVSKKAIADEQARLQQLESERLSREANKLKDK
ncbi:MAG: hypothetical protein SNI70_08650 [Rikenellaceae bacterium]